MKKPFPVAALTSALIAIRPKISDPQQSMLRAHYLNRTLSTGLIGRFGGYDSYSAANLHYGKLCGRVARELRFKPRGDLISTIASVAENRNSKGHVQWEMDEEVVKALDQVGWFSNLAEENLEPVSDLSNESPEVEREALIKARIGQGPFRTDVIALWGSCAVTGCSLVKALNASHIVPWIECSRNREKLDPLNGLLLTPNLDKLFDRMLIAFNDDGSILLSKDLGAEEKTILGVSEKSKLRFVRPKMQPYLKRNRALFREKQVRSGKVKGARAM